MDVHRGDRPRRSGSRRLDSDSVGSSLKPVSPRLSAWSESSSRFEFPDPRNQKETKNMQHLVSRIRARKGFTLVELAVVIVIIGVLAAFGVPRFLQSVEKSKAAEAFNYLSAIQGSEERYLAQNGQYASTISSLDVQLPPPQYFTVGTITTSNDGTGNPTWSLMLTRNANSSYAYTVNWTQLGFDTSSTSTIMTYPQICPVTVNGSSGS
jgi:prepilin-type N-terminal cleavage/methylation domain-containing protein